MRTLLVAVAALGASSFPALAQSSATMTCAHFGSMKTSDQMATVDSMHSRTAAANEMTSGGNTAANAASPSDHMSTHGLAKAMATTCQAHPDMKVEDAMHNAMAH